MICTGSVMSSKTKIVVLRMKELIYTAVFIGMAALLAILLFIMFRSGKDTGEAARETLYTPGVYTASLTVGGRNINVEVAVDSQSIQSVDFVSLDEAVATMYPLMQPAMAGLEEQILQKQSLEEVTYSDETRYTSQALLGAIETALQKAKTAR